MRESMCDEVVEAEVAEQTWPRYKGHPRSRWAIVNRIELVRAARPSYGPRECEQMQRTLAVLLGDMSETDPAPISRGSYARRASRASLARRAPESGQRATSPPSEDARRSARQSRRS